MPTKFLTKEGFQKLQEELDQLRTVKRQEVADRLHEAMEGGELIENAEYEAAKNEQAFVEGRIQELEMLLATARVIEPEDNPFLKAFYEGEPGAAFQTQFAFLVRRFEQLRALDLGPHSNKTVVADYIFEKDKLFACLNLNDQELDTYNRYFNYFREQLPTPDLVIYLQATPEVLKKRLKKKNAPGEKAISEDYLMEVVKAYEHFFFHYTQSDLLIVNTSEIDFVDRNEDLQELLKKVSAPIKGTQYFLPLGNQEAASV